MTNQEVKDDLLSNKVIGAALEVHKRIGPGLLENIYQYCMVRELAFLGISCEVETLLPVEYRGERLPISYRIDMVVEGELLLEFKSVVKVEQVHKAQLLSYLRLSGLRRGLLINFNVPFLREGLFRIVNNYKPLPGNTP
ncbi:MAG: GxxExxY protein [Planctomycetales bacterium]|nr:GxxExxY protein [bacterium]UNM09940.1 MAG: GxxExxY protein [Planctomycetales bacterium]